jgi:hypothetical protein
MEKIIFKQLKMLKMNSLNNVESGLTGASFRGRVKKGTKNRNF